DPSVESFVNPLIGTSTGGHVFPGATLPYGLAKPVADVNGDDNQGGFATDVGIITGFSHMHGLGNGGSPLLGNFPTFPQDGCPGDIVDNCNLPVWEMATPWVNCSVKAHPGDFSVDMNTNILAEMTVTNHTAIYRFTFVQIPKEANATLSPLILADTIDLSLSRNNASVQVDDYTGRISGSGTFSSSVGIVNYNLHFCADFSSARQF
ncbi:glycoside hydrolase family 92 protein, partial [Acidomyces richmondensis BFW]